MEEDRVNRLIENAKNVIFDVGCVLLLFEPENYIPLTVEGDLGLKLDPALVYGSDMWAKLDGGTASEEDVARDAARAYGDESLWPRILPAVQRFPEFMVRMPAADLLGPLHRMGKKLYVLSNYGKEPFARTEKRFSDIFAQMDGIMVSSRELVSKPDWRIYRRLMERYGLKAEECVFIDDRPENVAAARSMGMQGIVYTGIEVLIDEE